MNTENKQDTAEPTPASAGSVAGEPVAWGIQFWGGDIHYEVFDTKEKAEKEMYRGAPPDVCTAKVVSLHLKPTLTDAEREAVKYFAVIDGPRYLPQAKSAAATLLGLLERLK